MLKLLPHQESAVQFLKERRWCMLADEQGLGKTASSIMAAHALGLKHVLALVPAIVLHNWASEIRRWLPHASVQVISRGIQLIDPGANFVIVSHGLLRPARPAETDVVRQLGDHPFELAIVDEAQAFKTYKAARTQLLYKRVLPRAARLWLLTGTPMPNNPSELYPHLFHLVPERIWHMNFKQFRDRYCVTIPSNYGDGVRIIGSRNTKELRQVLKGFMLRRKLTEHVQMPPLQINEVLLTVPEKVLARVEAELPRRVRMRLAELRGDEDFEVTHLMRELGWVTEWSTWRRQCGLVKAEPAAELLVPELRDNPTRKIVLFAHHLAVVDFLKQVFDEFCPAVVTGSTNALHRHDEVHRFQTNPDCRVFIGQLQAAGVGITLTAAQHVILVEQSTVVSENVQAISRVFRIGQGKPVMVRVLVLADSIDEAVDKVLIRKLQMQAEVVG